METPSDMLPPADERPPSVLAQLADESLAALDNQAAARMQQQLLRQAGLRAGWDDPEMDVYNDLVD